jgi:hypothetical protein
MSLTKQRVMAFTVLFLVAPLSAAIATAAGPPFQEDDLVVELLKNYGLATVLILIGVVFLIRYWWPHHTKTEEQEQARKDTEMEKRIENEEAQTRALVEISAALQNVQRIQAQEVANSAEIGKALQETAVSTKVSADVLASQLTYLQDLNRYILESTKRGEE